MPPKPTPIAHDAIDVTRPRDRNYWCDKFDISEAELRNAVAAVGGSAAAVADYLGYVEPKRGKRAA